MDTRMKLIPALVFALLVSACATQPKPCTAEWFDWKTERLYADFAREHRTRIDQVRRDYSGASDGGLSSIMNGVQVALLAADFFASAVPEIDRAVGQCGSPPKAAQLFASFLRREGFDEKTLRAIEGLGLLMDRRG